MQSNFVLFAVVNVVGILAGVLSIRYYYKGSIFYTIGMFWLGTLVLMYDVTKLGDMLPNLFPVYLNVPLVLIVVILCFRFVSQRLVNPLNENIKSLKEIGKGNLRVSINSNYLQRQDELGYLSSAVKDVSQKLHELIDAVTEVSEEIEKQGEYLSSSSALLSQSVNLQASSIEEISSTMEEIVSSIQHNADNSKETESIVINANQSLEEGNKSTNIALDSMKEIAEKISIINDIAFQTNILALNAAVEAARAGDHGKGFAVVAAEVRRLAERSSKAANDIISVSHKGSHISVQARELMNKNLPEIRKSSKLIQEISAASQEQKIGSMQVNESVQQLNSITQQNAASAEELASNAELLTEKSKQLRDLISFFRV